MIYIIGILVGFFNGLFASGAGQILVFYLIFVRKFDTHQMRAVSVATLSLASIVTIIGYSNFVSLDFLKIVILVVVASISGYLGSKIMKKIPSNILNLISGILIVGLTVYKIVTGGA